MGISLSRVIYKRNRIDPTKISGPYSLLAVMLLVAEILFAIWFCKAEGSTERSIAGLIVATLFVCLMLIVMRMNRTPEKKGCKQFHNSLGAPENCCEGATQRIGIVKRVC